VIQVARTDLTRALRRLEKGGAELLRPLGRDRLEPASQADLESGQPLYLRMPGEARPTRLGEPAEIATLDDYLNGPPTPLKEAIASLVERGLVQDGPDAYKTLLHKEVLWATDRTLKELSRSASTPDHVLAMDFFGGSGVDRGLAQGERARSLKATAEAGLVSRWEAYDQYARPRPRLPVGSGASVPRLLVPESHLEDPDQVVQAESEWRSAFYRHLAPVLSELGPLDKSVYVPDSFRSLDGPFPLETRLQSAAVLLSAVAPTSKKPWQDAFNLYATAAQASQSSLELLRNCELLAGSVSLGMAPSLAQNPRGPHADVKDRIFEQLTVATGSPSVAAGAVETLRIRVGEESQQERLELFAQIASRLSPEQRQHAPALYQEILANRLPQESLSVTGQRYLQVLSACVQMGQPLLAGPVFEHLQLGISEGRIQPDQIPGLLAGGVMSGRFDRLPGQGGVRLEPDYALVGGVRVKGRQA
jgi:hypothetical protein